MATGSAKRVKRKSMNSFSASANRTLLDFLFIKSFRLGFCDKKKNFFFWGLAVLCMHYAGVLFLWSFIHVLEGDTRDDRYGLLACLRD